MTKKKRITISLSDEMYDYMMMIIKEINDHYKDDLIVSKSDYIENLIRKDFIDDWF